MHPDRANAHAGDDWGMTIAGIYKAVVVVVEATTLPNASALS